MERRRRAASAGLLLLVLALWAPSARAQREWSVGGSGSDFGTIQDAVDAASAGDVIRVDWGLYEGFHVQKPLQILGRPRPGQGRTTERVTILSDLSISTVPLGSALILSNLVQADARNVVTNCDGTVLFFRCSTAPTRVESCANFQLVECSSRGSLDGTIRALEFVSSSVFLQDSTVTIQRFLPFAFEAVDSTVQMVGTDFFHEGAQQPIGLLTGTSVSWGGGTYGNCLFGRCTAPLFYGDAGSSVVEIRREMPFLEPVPRDGAFELRILVLPADSLLVLACSSPGGVQEVTGGALWLDPGSALLLGATQTRPWQSVSWTFPLATLPELLGVPLTFQAGLLRPDGEFVLSNPVWKVF